MMDNNQSRTFGNNNKTDSSLEERVKRIMREHDEAFNKFDCERTRMLTHTCVRVPTPIAQTAYEYLLNKKAPMLVMESLSVIRKNFNIYLAYIFEEMFIRLKVEGKIDDALSLLAIETPEILSTIQEEALEKQKQMKSLESKCNYIARFLEDQERIEIFESLLSTLSGSKELQFSSICTGLCETSPEKQLAKIINVSQRVIFKWKNKQTIPNEENTAKIIIELLKRDPGRVNVRLNSILLMVKERLSETYTFLSASTP